MQIKEKAVGIEWQRRDQSCLKVQTTEGNCVHVFFFPEHLLTKLGGLECNPIRGKTPAIAQCRMVYWAKDPKTDILLRES